MNAASSLISSVMHHECPQISTPANYQVQEGSWGKRALRLWVRGRGGLLALELHFAVANALIQKAWLKADSSEAQLMVFRPEHNKTSYIEMISEYMHG